MRSLAAALIASAVIFFAPLAVSAEQEQPSPTSNNSAQIIIIDADEDSFTGSSIMGSVCESRNSGWRKRASLSGRGGMVVNTAKRFIGVPYVWGGTSPSGFDCSGFIKSVYAQHGIDVRRLADEQYYGGKKLSRSELTAGDLVFFSTYEPGVSHVGIYVGDGKFIHASSSRGVTIDSLDSDYYRNAYVGACRYW